MRKCTCPKPLINGLLTQKTHAYLVSYPFIIAVRRMFCPIHSHKKMPDIDDVLEDLNSRKYGSWDGEKEIYG